VTTGTSCPPDTASGYTGPWRLTSRVSPGQKGCLNDLAGLGRNFCGPQAARPPSTANYSNFTLYKYSLSKLTTQLWQDGGPVRKDSYEILALADVPEPGSMAMIGLGLAGLILRRVAS